MYWRKIFITASLFFAIFITNINADDELNLSILQALTLQNDGNIENSIVIYEELFEKTKQVAYLKEALKLAYASSSPKLKELLEKSEVSLKDDSEFIRIKVADMVNAKQFSYARNIMRDLVSKEPNVRNILILGTICMLQNDSITALRYFEEAYNLDKNEETLLRIVDVLINQLEKPQDALSYLQRYKDEFGCTIKICETMSDLYLQTQNFTKMVEICEELYAISQNKNYLEKALQIFIYDKNYKAAAEFLKKYSYNDTVLMEIYATMKSYGDAYVLAVKIYNDTRDLEFLARAAVFEYEMYDKHEQKQLESVIDKFEASVVKLDKEIYLNYYGYLLIDHDVDVKKGISLVKRALEISPDSPYYQDSLAWGYYKLGDCKKAKEIMLKAIQDFEFKNTKEAKEHLNLIEKCIKKSNKGSKK
ncbi:tetratricopeptide repeat protein [Campylobacter sp. 7477a]|uniref:tetratricopeptide repeat protein n=1 Tax=Campylobacter sp. 7477a TaxID=2735741 RepID=UPI003014FFE2|nr:hypothetical protein [Campylobacter sp. 7477a]